MYSSEENCCEILGKGRNSFVRRFVLWDQFRVGKFQVGTDLHKKFPFLEPFTKAAFFPSPINSPSLTSISTFNIKSLSSLYLLLSKLFLPSPLKCVPFFHPFISPLLLLHFSSENCYLLPSHPLISLLSPFFGRNSFGLVMGFYMENKRV